MFRRERRQLDRLSARNWSSFTSAAARLAFSSSMSSRSAGALAAGAHAIHALDTSLDYLRETVLVLLGLDAAREHRRAGLGTPVPVRSERSTRWRA